MIRTKSAFTIIEVSLFIAISSFLIAGIIAGTSASIFRQRYQDSVNSFTEFLRDVYSKVINVENIRETGVSENFTCTVASSQKLDGAKPGRSECVLYGKLVTFGEDNDATTVHVYDVVGGATIRQTANDLFKDLETKDINSVIQALAGVGADVVAPKLNNTSVTNFAAGHSTYTPEWGATLEKADGGTFKASLLIARSPLSGSVHTFILHDQTIAASTEVEQSISTGSSNYLSTILKNQPDKFDNKNAINICIGSDDIATFGNRRRNIRILADGNTASSVELIPLDSGDNECLK